MSVLTSMRAFASGSAVAEPAGRPAAVAIDPEQLIAAVARLGDGAAALTVDDHGRRALAAGLTLAVVSHDPPLILTTLREDEPALGPLLMHRHFTLALADTVLDCMLHDTGDAGERVVVIGWVTAITPA